MSISPFDVGRTALSVQSSRVILTTIMLIAFAAWPQVTCHAVEGDSVSFERQVAPLLKKHCVRCHGPKAPKADLDLSTPAALVKGGDSGQVVRSGKPNDSLLFEMIDLGEMPPEDEGRISSDEKALIYAWIAQGAPFRNGLTANTGPTQHDILPLLLLRCGVCHGTRKQESGLDVRSLASLLKGGKSGPAVVAGKSDESLLVKRIRAQEMPPRRKLVSASVKPMSEPELRRLTAWITAGMPTADARLDQADHPAEVMADDEARSFWSFQPPRAVTPPRTGDEHLTRTPVDAFVLRQLEQRQMSFSPEADRVTLIRRVYFDLLGLPPTPEEVAEFVADSDPLAFERLVDCLLASPRYGVRWGRHWLDVAGYADSEGAQNEDRVRPNMWRYRDYVIQAFNADKPYDYFLQQQLAGDELADYANAPRITPTLYDNLVATGFMRTVSDRTFAGITNFVPDRLEVIAEEIQVLGSAVLGLTLHCARCHSHKFDPLPQHDYYRLAATLKDALDEHDWIQPEARVLTYVTTDERLRWQSHNQQLDTEIATVKEQMASEADDEKRKALESSIKRIEGRRLPEPKIRALWSRGEPSPTYVLRRGNYLTPGRPVEPGVPSVLVSKETPFEITTPAHGANTTGRRLALARWITRPKHPLTARVMVNRIWKHHFGQGLVTTLDNFGKMGAAPSHPDLLDWLAREFVRQDWSIKSLHRLVLTSRTYRQSSLVSQQGSHLDPDGRWLSRMPMRRMEGEVLRDSLLLIADQLDETPFGPPDAVEAQGDGRVISTRGSQGWRRSMFVLQRRTKIPTILENFDFPQMGPNCVHRDESIVAPQALHLLNDAMVYELAEQFAERVLRGTKSTPCSTIELAYQIALSRSPTEQERDVAEITLRELEDRWRHDSIDNTDSSTKSPEARSPEEQALVTFCHALMNSAAFLYID
ncbi:MAG: PSD1 and planctomycete cytochrome C domain-containing protein [Pirellulaceae bacterium]|jgi:mono/diheme cytochrome c family protein|nr:PSD1 and planctomycete cytochrome C domain-containing protein [Pirellulaceae bacterium]